MSKPKYSITTAIDYPNGAPHLGHAYEKTVTDAYARWHRLLGHDVYFLTGTDENGQKLVKTAESLGKDTQAFVDENVVRFKELCSVLNISYDDFIRTTEDRHVKAVQDFWKKLEAKGDIYFSSYEGKYCLNCEAYYTDLQAPEGKCPEHHTALDLVKEEGYFFKTSQYQNWIIEHIKSQADFVSPDLSKKEILARLESEPMRDLSITRPNKGWGIPVPGKPEYVVYTWFDALINYYTASEPKGYWPNSLHVIGRDILWFHAVIWPMMLHSAGIPLPKQIYVHGMVLAADGKKMSKSLNNGVDPFEAVSKVPVDSFRYYILRAIPANGNGAFSMDDLLKRHQSELGNDYGNLLMRVVKLARKRVGDDYPNANYQLAFDFSPVMNEVKDLMAKHEHHRALDRIWHEVNVVNGYINDQAPWSLKDDQPEQRQKFLEVMYNGLYGIDVVTQLLSSFIPDTASKALASIGKTVGVLDAGAKNYTLSDPPVLFPRIEPAPGAAPAVVAKPQKQKQK
jgi:methionyl-tRNA synthetase